MSKAEERALEKYPLMSEDDKEGLEALKYVGMECECASAFNEVQEAKQLYFIEGYHQAEKDLDILSWVKEVSGVKELSRAKEEALKAYPPQSIAANYDTIARRDAFEFGYLKAEKDLELGWEDIQKIDVLIYAVLDEEKYKRYYTQDRDGDFYEEVLKRFKNFKERKKQ